MAVMAIQSEETSKLNWLLLRIQSLFYYFIEIMIATTISDTLLGHSCQFTTGENTLLVSGSSLSILMPCWGLYQQQYTAWPYMVPQKSQQLLKVFRLFVTQPVRGGALVQVLRSVMSTEIIVWTRHLSVFTLAHLVLQSRLATVSANDELTWYDNFKLLNWLHRLLMQYGWW